MIVRINDKSTRVGVLHLVLRSIAAFVPTDTMNRRIVHEKSRGINKGPKFDSSFDIFVS